MPSLGLGNRLKDALSSTSRTDRDANTAERTAATAFADSHHDGILAALGKAKETGYPAHVGTDMNGHEVFVEPPAGYSAVPQMMMPKGSGRKVKGQKEMEMGMGRGFGIQPGYDPYRDENARFIMPLQKDTRQVGPRGESGWGFGRERRSYGYGYGYGGYPMMGMGMCMW